MTDHKENNGNEAQKSSNAQSENNHQENLIHLSEKNMTNNTSDLNAQLKEIETDLQHLNAREAATNKAFRELMSETRRHGENQDEQLNETRRDISTIKDQYKKLNIDYQRLVANSNILSVTLEQARSEISTQIESLKLSTQERDDELTDNYLQLIERTNRIESKATQTTKDLDARINVVDTTISAIEKKLMAQIKEFAQQSEQRDEALSIRTDMIEEEFKEEIESLNQQSFALNNRSTLLESHSEQLEESTSQHRAHLKNIDQTVDRHRKGFAVAMVLIVITLGILSLFQNAHWQENNATDVALQDQLSQQIIQQAQQTDRIQILEAKHQEQNTLLTESDQKITTSIEKLEASLQSLQDKTANNISRVNAMSPYRTFGKDNTLHNQQWLAQQNKEHYVIEVISATNKQELYNLVYRWSRAFNKSHLSVIETNKGNTKSYTLIYGTFSDQRQAQLLSQRLPIMDFAHRPTVKKLAQL